MGDKGGRMQTNFSLVLKKGKVNVFWASMRDTQVAIRIFGRPKMR